jgi:uncharacterized protein YjbI with pentapeptide repeats
MHSTHKTVGIIVDSKTPDVWANALVQSVRFQAQPPFNSCALWIMPIAHSGSKDRWLVEQCNALVIDATQETAYLDTLVNHIREVKRPTLVVTRAGEDRLSEQWDSLAQIVSTDQNLLPVLLKALAVEDGPLCTVAHYGQPCGRVALHGPPEDRRCIFHDDDPEKEHFWEMLDFHVGSASALNVPLDCRAFVFPAVEQRRRFPSLGRVKSASFDGAVFLKTAFLNWFCTESGRSSLRDAEFREELVCSSGGFVLPEAASISLDGARCQGEVIISAQRLMTQGSISARGATFEGRVWLQGEFESRFDASSALFNNLDTMSYCRFMKGATFELAEFRGKVSLGGVCLDEGAELNMNGARFHQDVSPASLGGVVPSLQRARFLGKMFLINRELASPVDFRNATFEDEVDCSSSRCKAEVRFGRARFKKAVVFSGTTFSQGADFSSTVFEGTAQFSRIQVGRADDAEFCIDVSHAVMLAPEKVSFAEANAAEAWGLRLRIAGTDVRKMSFEGVRWLEREGALVVQDEVDFESGGPLSHITAERVAAAYRRLTISFSELKQYDLMEQCIYRTLETERRNPRTKLLRKGALTGYRMLSGYGANYQRAGVILVGLVLVFGAVFALHGEAVPDQTTAVALTSNARQLLERVTSGVVHSLETATFAKTDSHAYNGPIVTTSEGMERVLVPGQLALLVLALRRRFRA